VSAPEPALRRWLATWLGTEGPFEIRPISGGNSNETALLSVLAGQDVPAPRPIAFAEAGEATARPCLLMEFSPGHPLTDRWPDGWPA
jgi:aminoglycoside phosphotransferase (APT) family kinase protein